MMSRKNLACILSLLFLIFSDTVQGQETCIGEYCGECQATFCQKGGTGICPCSDLEMPCVGTGLGMYCSKSCITDDDCANPNTAMKCLTSCPDYPDVEGICWEAVSADWMVSDVCGGLEINGPTSVPENSGAQYQCTAYWSDGSSLDVTNDATWSEDCEGAEIDAGGFLTTYDIASDEYCQVTANYSGRNSFLDISIIGSCSPDSYEPDNSAGQAKSISSGSAQEHSICPAGDEDWVTFTLSEESGVAIETTGISGDTRMWLYDAGLNEVEYNDDGGEGLFSYIDRLCNDDALPAGTYYIKIDEYNNDDAIEIYTLSLIVNSCSTPNCICDVSGDGNCTPQDALCSFQVYLGICPTGCGACEDICCDVTGDGLCTPADALCRFQEYLGIHPNCFD